MSMSAENPQPDTELTTSAWSADGEASFEVTGSNHRAVLEAGLNAVLRLAGAASREPAASGDLRSAPIRGEGDDLDLLFTDLVDDLLDQADYFGADVHDVTIDGLARREDGGFVAWGYASGVPGRGGGLTPLSLNAPPTISEHEPTRLTLRASFRRGRSPSTPATHSVDTPPLSRERGE